MPKAKPGAEKPFMFPIKRILNGMTYYIYDVKKETVIKEELTDMVSDWIGDKFSLPIQRGGNAPGKLMPE